MLKQQLKNHIKFTKTEETLAYEIFTGRSFSLNHIINITSGWQLNTAKECLEVASEAMLAQPFLV